MSDSLRLGPDRGGRFPTLGLLVVLLPLAAAFGTWKYVEIKALRPLNLQVATLRKSFDASQSDQDKMAKEVERMKRQVGALQTIAKVEILWGGATDKGKAPETAKETKVEFAFTRNGSNWVSPHEINGTVWYYADQGDTLARIAAQPRVFGTWWLWPILAQENNLKVTGIEPLAAGTLIRIPNRIAEQQIRRAITEAGTPDKAKDEILAQAGLKP